MACELNQHCEVRELNFRSSSPSWVEQRRVLKDASQTKLSQSVSQSAIVGLLAIFKSAINTIFSLYLASKQASQQAGQSALFIIIALAIFDLCDCDCQVEKRKFERIKDKLTFWVCSRLDSRASKRAGHSFNVISNGNIFVPSLRGRIEPSYCKSQIR